jgi:hypothetical protein
MEAVIFVYDGDGTLEIMQFAGLKADLPADKYTALLQAGFRFHQEISVPAKGEYFLRIGVHDETSNKVGAVELPVAAVSKLPPVTATGPK